MKTYEDEVCRGTCPECGDDLRYVELKVDTKYVVIIDMDAVDTVYFEAKCSKCGWKGREVYSLEFLYLQEEEK